MHEFKRYIFRSAAAALLFALPVGLHAQFRDPGPSAHLPKAILPFSEITFFQNYTSDSDSSPQTIPGLEGEKVIAPSHKSVFLAGVLSFILPGLGEYYVGDEIWRGIIFTSIDALFWYEQFHYISRGNDSTIAYHIYADTNFSPVAYADSLNSFLAKSGRTNFRIDTNKVKRHDFSDLNTAEDSLEIFGFQDMSHRLPQYGSQDYYEVISKWQQFVFGWRDYRASGPPTSPEFEEHKTMRGDMNHQFDIANYFLYGLFLNRVLSAIDAALLARDHNSHIHLEGELRRGIYPNGMIGFIPTAKLRYTF